MSDRENEDWLDAYLQYTEPSEPPRSYHTWAGLSLIAGSLQRKVYLKWGIGQIIYPNLFVVLVGPSGRARKGVAIGIAKDLLVNLSTISVAAEAASREAIILAMKRANTNYTDKTTGEIRPHCSITAFSEELSVLLGQSDIKMLANLTDWYDSKETWTYETVGRGRDSLQGLCVNLLGATAPDWLQSMLPQEAVGGGFTSRVIFVVEERKGKTVPKYEPSIGELALKESLIRDLERIHNLAGEASFTGPGEQCYVTWYTQQDKLLDAGTQAVDDRRFAGYCERRSTHLRKLMLLCSASRGSDLLITEADFRKALSILEMTECKMAKTFGGLGRALNSDLQEQLMNFIQQVGVTTRSALMQRFYRDVDPAAFSSIEQSLIHMQLIDVKLLSGGDKLYTWKTMKQ